MRLRPLTKRMINKLTFAAHILGVAVWCGAAAAGRAADTPAPPVPAVSASQAVRRQERPGVRRTVLA